MSLSWADPVAHPLPPPRLRFRPEEEDNLGAERLTYPSDVVDTANGAGTGSRLCRALLLSSPPSLLLAALFRLCTSSACSTARRFAALSANAPVDDEEEALRCAPPPPPPLRLLSRETGASSAAARVCEELVASAETSSGTVDKRSGVRIMELRSLITLGDCALAPRFVGLTAMVRSIVSGAR